ncbi:MAG: OB-fold nucleic acid binding domain-containing protein, partial [Candidatus Korobacteraceae bacterium]
MSLEDNIYDLRKQKLQQIEALGQPAYPHHFSPTHQVPQILAAHSAGTGEELEAARPEVTVAGRLVAIRLMGKASFAHLQQSGEKLQIYIKKDAVGDKLWELYKLLDIGDHVGVKGYLFRTRTGELSIHVEELTFLS